MDYIVMVKDGDSWEEIDRKPTLAEAVEVAPIGARIESWNGCTTIVQAGDDS